MLEEKCYMGVSGNGLPVVTLASENKIMRLIKVWI